MTLEHESTESRVKYLLIALALLSACERAVETEIAYSSDEGADAIFSSGAMNCDYDSQKLFSNHTPPYTKVTSLNQRWTVRAGPALRQNAFELFDEQNEKLYVIFHGNYKIELLDIAFDKSSSHLSFIGTPWALGGLSEIYTLELNTMSFTRFGSPRGSYRHPTVVSESGGMLFYEATGGSRIKSRSFLELVGADRISFRLGYRNSGGDTFYMPSYSGARAEFVVFDEQYSSDGSYYQKFESFVSPPAIRLGDQQGTYFAYNDDPIGAVKGFDPDHLYEVDVFVENDMAYVTGERMVDRLENIYLIRPRWNKSDELISKTHELTETICLQATNYR